MEEFKVGDWVICNIEPFKITNINNGIINSHCEIKECILWQPKEGEWCWFWNNEKDLTMQKFWKIEQGYFIVPFYEKNKSDGLVYYNITTTHFKNCEPFIGELPTFLKDKK